MSTMATVVFFIFAIIAVASAWGVVTSKNIVHSAFFLALSFAGVAVLYILLNAEYLAAVQLLVYAGAISIMVIFAVMLTLRGDVADSSPVTKKWASGALVGSLVFILLALVILTHSDWRILAMPALAGGTTVELSKLLLTWYMVPFEAAAILLTLALIGAVIIAKGGHESR
ncbi:NADH:ubiquinone oxidoreductase subunit 6 (chain J) [Desulfitobacterium dichloroeliminans LMG P-21439]|uniref:NADH-quinone oxidoreductase subunit J n=1 Tax=Desulfitobacterium dichloroeliminans (strain LMG P-21439 / DCA1) TaxID=871963 RepID=L0FAL8_DESDL|nr:NADH-quinone oxidoreductase subunit J [Desulfitobacterium dichloroeliminans]AGA70050.1 NADH:ubiquinone oxidoreductase subunit 6 (chain J) [Desulfitobacterium dichloroeliminans LMG P-21439]